MTKSQALLSVAAILLTFLLFSLPKSVVDTKTKSQVTSPSQAHNKTAKTEQSNELISLRTAFEKASLPQKKPILDSLVVLFKKQNFYDSAAHYTEKWATASANFDDLLLAADLYYEAASFAVDAQKKDFLAKKALDMYQNLLQKKPNDLDLKVKTGMSQTLTADPMKGILAIREVLQNNPKHELALYQMGILSIESGQWDKAIERFETLLSVNPAHAEAHFLLGKGLVEKKQIQEAKTHFEFVSKNAKDSTLRKVANDALLELN